MSYILIEDGKDTSYIVKLKALEYHTIEMMLCVEKDSPDVQKEK
jgi:hypothetical protein